MTMTLLFFFFFWCRGGGQWNIGKAFDTFAPLGPEIVPLASDTELRSRLQNLSIKCLLNGKEEEFLKSFPSVSSLLLLSFLFYSLRFFLCFCSFSLLFSSASASAFALYLLLLLRFCFSRFSSPHFCFSFSVSFPLLLLLFFSQILLLFLPFLSLLILLSFFSSHS